MYYVLVYGYQASNFTLTATTGAAPVRLFSGVSQRMWVTTGACCRAEPACRRRTNRLVVRAGNHASFYYIVDSVVDISVAVTPFTGDPDLYVAFGYEPNSSACARRARDGPPPA